MAESVLDAAATGRANPRLLTPADVDEITVVRDTGAHEEEEGSE